MLIETIQKPPLGAGIDFYSLDALSGTMAAGLAANAPIFSCRWANTSYVALVRRVSLAMSSLGTAFTAGVGRFELVVAEAFTVSDSGGSSVKPTNNNQTLRATMATSRVTDLRISSTATLTAGTRTLDANPLRRLMFAVGAVANTVYLPTTILFGSIVDADYPLVLGVNEGFIVRATVPATGTWQVSVCVEWGEIAIN